MGVVRVAVTGAAGQIGYASLFRIASGQMLGPDVEIEMNLLELPQAMGALLVTLHGRATVYWLLVCGDAWPRQSP